MDVLKHLPELLAGGESLVLALIVGRSGSAPRAAGARMAVHAGGALLGTIGGGILEARVRELAGEVFTTRRAILEEFEFTDGEAGRMGMVCGGRVRVLIHFVDASNPAQVRLYGEIHAALKSRKREWLITELPSGEEGEAAPRQALRGNADTLPGTIDGETIRALGQESAPSRPRLVLLDGRRFFVEPLGPGGSVYIFGAGHISRELAPLASLVGFQTIVIDDRVEFANRERFETADEIIVPDSFERAFEGLEITGESFLVLVTRGHSHDKTVLGEALKTGAGYIGMIGSRGKRDAVYDALRKEGFSPREFERVHSPVGLDIGAETPEEIAVSIVAELIRVRAGRNL